MKTWFLVALLVTACSSGRGSAPAPGAPAAPLESRRISSLPENPCDLLPPDQLAVAAGLKVVRARRMPDIGEILRAEKEGRTARVSAICNYDTSADVGDITIIVPGVAEQNEDAYRRDRDAYFRQFQGQAVGGVGEDAWLGGGNRLHVLAGKNAYFIVVTRYAQSNSRDVTVAAANAIIRRLSR